MKAKLNHVLFDFECKDAKTKQTIAEAAAILEAVTKHT
jgi:hypothetical protein